MLRESKSLFVIGEAAFLGFIGFEIVRRSLAFYASNGTNLILESRLMELVRAMCIFIFSSSRVPQIWSNFKNKSTGSLSSASLWMQCSSSLARIFTTLSDSKNSSPSVLLSFIIAASLSGTLILQIALYKDNTTKGELKQATFIRTNVSSGSKKKD
eukprot:TRINITY_DN5837_c0_g1_i2.p1 TRINITY_DN5837_c0_g1~~TRINITY_DN5837_c0_g1_i2.p1  ORF type:complete len:156 (-),score=54.84 TRINITY_DN5837_c0_g1_i2:73-540(-)